MTSYHMPLTSRRIAVASTLLLAVSACGGQNQQAGGSASGEEVGDRLDEAAKQSAPTARRVLENAADEARQRPSMAPVDQPGSYAQEAMSKAGEAEAKVGGSQPKR